ncbi:hypothetical protein Nepgr_026549 [Nepenthes gracilis]|uniref:AB hydrolase-1 domain-containing protein n=1 Tax=Nepenthes gracilis TaxID=150966 RepID=A0AAD3Y2L4_NEPGR|nr:hypothetical protein Nepgr_026549 [Nepenthes gracilis]
MANCFSFTATKDRCYRFSFARAGLKSTTTELGEGTVIHCWAPKKHKDGKPALLLIHGFGANAMWQWDYYINLLIRTFNVYVPDLVFFGDSYTTRPDRTEAFQAQCLMSLMKGFGVQRMNAAGISYGGFVAYSLAAQFPASVEKVVLCSAGVCLEEKDMADGLFVVNSVKEAASILLPQTPEKMRELIRLSFFKPIKHVPSCFLDDYIHVMCTEFIEEKNQLLEALIKDRKLADLPKITQPTLIIWGEEDKIFPLPLAHRLKTNLGDNAQLVIIKEAGHGVYLEKTKEVLKHMKRFLVESGPSCGSSSNGANAV